MGSKILENVPNQPSDICNAAGEGRECYLFWALECVLKYAGESVDYNYLMGVSGCAFRLLVSADKICASGPDVSSDYYFPLALGAVGYTDALATYGCGGMAWDDVAATKKAIRASIDNDLPVITFAPFPFYGVIVGYRDDRFVVQQHYPTPRTQEMDISGGALMVLKKDRELPPKREEVRKSFRIAVDRARRDHLFEDDPESTCGLAAYDEWIRQLRRPVLELLGWGKDVEFTGSAFDTETGEWSKDEYMGYWHSNSWPYMALVDARSAAARYLGQVSELFGGDERAAIGELSQRFSKIETHLRSNWNLFPQTHWVDEEKDQIWSPAGTVEGTVWTDDMRRRGADALAQARQLEAEAYDVMEELVP